MDFGINNHIIVLPTTEMPYARINILIRIHIPENNEFFFIK